LHEKADSYNDTKTEGRSNAIIFTFRRFIYGSFSPEARKGHKGDWLLTTDETLDEGNAIRK